MELRFLFVVYPVSHKPGEDLNPDDFQQIDRVCRLVNDELAEDGIETDPLIFSAPGNCSSATAGRMAANLGICYEVDERLSPKDTHGPFPVESDEVIELVNQHKDKLAIILVTHIGRSRGTSDNAKCFITEYFEEKLGIRVPTTFFFDGGFQFQCKSTL